MTVGNPEFNLDSFGIKYVKKAKEAHESGGDSGITARTTSLLSNQDIATSGFGDRQNDSKGDTDVKVHNQTDQPKTSKQVHSAGQDRYGVGGTEGSTQGGKDETGTGTQSMTSSGKLGKPSGKKVGTEASQDSGIKDHYSGQKRDAAGNVNTYKKPEGQTLPKNASLNLAIIKCKLLKVKASGGDSNYKSTPSTKEPISGIAPEVTETTKGTGDKIPAEKLGDLPVGKVDEKEVGGTEIEDQHGKTRKLTSPHEAYKAEVREMAIDAIDMAMKTIAMYQDKKEKSLQEELIKDAYEAQLKNDSANTSDGVNAVYSDVHQKKINKE
jgi:hypothetical protein|tara:strand:- start:1352 stop:2326 length:975 start_codon:yes stop_codon:yes gene_type:complete